MLEPTGNIIFSTEYHQFMSNSVFGTEQGIAVGRLVFTVSRWHGSADETNLRCRRKFRVSKKKRYI
jgi:hypothetical protein